MDICRLFFILFLLASFLDSFSAIPRRGLEPWSLILCKFKDLANYEPNTREWFSRWLHGKNEPDSIEQFFWQVSNGIYSIAGSNVYGWFTLPYTQQEVLRLANNLTGPGGISPPPLGSDSSFDYFDKVKELCVIEAQKNGNNSQQLHRQKITVVNAGTAAVYGKKNGVLLTPQLMFSSVLTHEMVHSFFIGHSYSDRKIKVFPYASNGEYDDRYDLMSTANAYMHRSKFGMSGPGLNGAHLDYLGWLPMDRVLYFGRDGRQNYTLRLSSLSIPHNNTLGWLFVLIPFDRDNPNNYYSVELRTPHQFDRGLALPSILIHKVQKSGESYYSQLISQADFYELTDEGTEWVTFLEQLSPNSIEEGGGASNRAENGMRNFQFIRVSLKKVYSMDADIQIVSTFSPIECRLGEQVFRAARWSQPYIVGLRQVCLSAKNAELNESTTTLSTTTPNGIDNLLTIERRQKRDVRSIRVLSDVEMRRQFARRNFFLLRRTFGANACRQGLVWRALDPYDYVCVTEKRRQLAQGQDQLQNERVATRPDISNIVGLGNPCIEPYLPRRAFTGDDICVSAAEKFRVFRENLQAYSTLLNVAFFNGLDTIGP